MTIAREEIFGPVLSVISYDDLDDAVRIGNDTEYGLAAYISGEDKDKILTVARQLRAGQFISIMPLAAPMRPSAVTASPATDVKRRNGVLMSFWRSRPSSAHECRG